MANVQMTNNNKVALLTDWKNNANNRGNVLYYVTNQINVQELQESAFNAKVLIAVAPVDAVLSKITFVDILS
jgi:hypothetical protein